MPSLNAKKKKKSDYKVKWRTVVIFCSLLQDFCQKKMKGLKLYTKILIRCSRNHFSKIYRAEIAHMTLRAPMFL